MVYFLSEYLQCFVWLNIKYCPGVTYQRYHVTNTAWYQVYRVASMSWSWLVLCSARVRLVFNTSCRVYCHCQSCAMYSTELSYLLREKPRNRIKLRTARTVRPQTSVSHFIRLLPLLPSLPSVPPVWTCSVLCVVIVISTTPPSGSPYLFSWGRTLLVVWDQFWLPGRPARHHQTKPCWQPSYWSLRSPVSSSPVTPDCQIISFRSHFSLHPATRMSPLSHPAQF